MRRLQYSRQSTLPTGQVREAKGARVATIRTLAAMATDAEKGIVGRKANVARIGNAESIENAKRNTKGASTDGAEGRKTICAD